MLHKIKLSDKLYYANTTTEHKNTTIDKAGIITNTWHSSSKASELPNEYNKFLPTQASCSPHAPDRDVL